MSATDDEIWLMPGPEADNPPPASPASAEPSPPHESSGDVHLGEHLAGRFVIRQRLGQGGMATVYEAHDSLRNEPVAVKLLIPTLLADPEAVRQFRSEATIATRLSHPNIVTVYDFHAVDDSYAIVMERLVGKTLREFISERKAANERFSPAAVEQILAPLCEALAYAHRFTIHRDVKPENIWITEDRTIKLMDFGLAKLVRRGADPLSLVTLTQLRLGSPYYMAPEQLHEAERATAASDQFAVGVIAYELLAGELPIGLAKPLRDLRPDLPYQLTDTVDRALANDPADRFASIQDFHAAFREGIESRVSWRQHLETRPKLRRALTLTGAGVLVAALVIGTSTVLDRRNETRATAARHAQNRLLDARSQAETVRRAVENAAESKAETASTHATFKSANPDDPPARFQEELTRARLERQAAIAETAWSWLALRLDENYLPLDVSEHLAALEAAVRGEHFSGVNAARASVADAIGRETQVISQAQALAASQHRLKALMTGSESPSHALFLDMPGWQPDEDNWNAALSASHSAEQKLRTSRQARFEELADAHRTAEERWAAFFPKRGPPPLEFIGHPTAHAETARQWAALDRFDRAIPMLESALDTITGWADELEALHNRCAESWAKAQAEGRAFENVIGMRFIRIDNHYWSVWETRVMDFARFAAAEDGNSEALGSFWKDPGFPLSPTQPVLGIPHATATHFSHWLRHHYRGEVTDQVEHNLPGQGQFESLLAKDPRWQKMDRKRALFPNRNELVSRSWFDEYRDESINAANFIKPVAMNPPAASGLYDLFSNTWEWAADLRTPSKQEFDAAGSFHVLYGGGTFGEVSYHGLRPPAHFRLVGRPDAVGFRVVMDAKNLDDALARRKAQR